MRTSTNLPTKIGVSRSVHREASVSRRVIIRCMKSAGSSASKAGMNSWSSIPKEYVVWFVTVTNLPPISACWRIAFARSSNVRKYHGRTFTKG